MTQVEFVHHGNLYRIAIVDEELTMSHHHSETGWNEVGRLTVAAAGVLADLDGIVHRRPTMTVVEDAAAHDHAGGDGTAPRG